MSTVIALADVRARHSYAARAAEEAAADTAARAAAREALRGLLTALAPLEARAPGAVGVGLSEFLRGAMVARVAELAEAVAAEAQDEAAGR